eukprot:gene20013-26728_t
MGGTGPVHAERRGIAPGLYMPSAELRIPVSELPRAIVRDPLRCKFDIVRGRQGALADGVFNLEGASNGHCLGEREGNKTAEKFLKETAAVAMESTFEEAELVALCNAVLVGELGRVLSMDLSHISGSRIVQQESLNDVRDLLEILVALSKTAPKYDLPHPAPHQPRTSDTRVADQPHYTQYSAPQYKGTFSSGVTNAAMHGQYSAPQYKVPSTSGVTTATMHGQYSEPQYEEPSASGFTTATMHGPYSEPQYEGPSASGFTTATMHGQYSEPQYEGPSASGVTTATMHGQYSEPQYEGPSASGVTTATMHGHGPPTSMMHSATAHAHVHVSPAERVPQDIVPATVDNSRDITPREEEGFEWRDVLPRPVATPQDVVPATVDNSRDITPREEEEGSETRDVFPRPDAKPQTGYNDFDQDGCVISSRGANPIMADQQGPTILQHVTSLSRGSEFLEQRPAPLNNQFEFEVGRGVRNSASGRDQSSSKSRQSSRRHSVPPADVRSAPTHAWPSPGGSTGAASRRAAKQQVGRNFTQRSERPATVRASSRRATSRPRARPERDLQRRQALLAAHDGPGESYPYKDQGRDSHGAEVQHDVRYEVPGADEWSTSSLEGVLDEEQVLALLGMLDEVEGRLATGDHSRSPLRTRQHALDVLARSARRKVHFDDSSNSTHILEASRAPSLHRRVSCSLPQSASSSTVSHRAWNSENGPPLPQYTSQYTSPIRTQRNRHVAEVDPTMAAKLAQVYSLCEADDKIIAAKNRVAQREAAEDEERQRLRRMLSMKHMNAQQRRDAIADTSATMSMLKGQAHKSRVEELRLQRLYSDFKASEQSRQLKHALQQELVNRKAFTQALEHERSSILTTKHMARIMSDKMRVSKAKAKKAEAPSLLSTSKRRIREAKEKEAKAPSFDYPTEHQHDKLAVTLEDEMEQGHKQLTLSCKRRVSEAKAQEAKASSFDYPTEDQYVKLVATPEDKVDQGQKRVSEAKAQEAKAPSFDYPTEHQYAKLALMLEDKVANERKRRIAAEREAVAAVRDFGDARAELARQALTDTLARVAQEEEAAAVRIAINPKAAKLLADKLERVLRVV